MHCLGILKILLYALANTGMVRFGYIQKNFIMMSSHSRCFKESFIQDGSHYMISLANYLSSHLQKKVNLRLN